MATRGQKANVVILRGGVGYEGEDSWVSRKDFVDPIMVDKYEAHVRKGATA